MYASWDPDADWSQVILAAPWLLEIEGYQAGPEMFVFFETEDEMVQKFNMTIGDDGPNDVNPYKGPVKVYALTCSPEGNLLTENT